MIKKVVPLAEKHPTIDVFTLQDFDKPLGLWILILVNLKLSSPGYCFVNFEWLWVESVARYDLHSVYWFRYLCSNFGITDLISSYYFGNPLVLAFFTRAAYRLFSFSLVLSPSSFQLLLFFGARWGCCFGQLNYSLGLEIDWASNYFLTIGVREI